MEKGNRYDMINEGKYPGRDFAEDEEGVPKLSILTVVTMYLATVAIILAGGYVMVAKFLQTWSAQ